MHLAEILALRPLPVAGLIIELTRRCPLSCPHCSTSSTSQGRDLDHHALNRFLDGLAAVPGDAPAVVSLTGGEPLLRPGAVRDVVERCHGVGTAVHVLTGGYFARRRSLPPAIAATIAAVDHLAMSLDAFHELEVPRHHVFATLEAALAIGTSVSLQVTGTSDDDPYLHGLVADVTERFGDDVPMLVSAVRPIGRARELPVHITGASTAPPPATLDTPRTGRDQGGPSGTEPAECAADDATVMDAATGGATPSPCAMAAWPVVCSDGRITGCCNQDVVDGAVHAAHLHVGDLDTTTWAEVRHRMVHDPVRRCLRTVGPEYLAERIEVDPAASYCGTCHGLGQAADVEPRTRAAIRPQLLEALEALANGPADPSEGFAARYGLASFSHLASTEA